MCSTDYKLALKSSLYDFQSARDFYREATAAAKVGMHRSLILRYIELQALLITPIAPHWAEYIWLEILHKPDTIQNALFPTDIPLPDPALSATRDYVRATASNITSAEANASKKLSKGKAITFDPRKPKRLTVYCAKDFPAWQEKYIDMLSEAFDATSLTIDDKALNAKVSKAGEMKKAMPFVQGLKRRLVQQKEKPETVFNRKLAFDELAVLKEMRRGLMRTTGCRDVSIVSVKEVGGKGVGGVTMEGEIVEGLQPVAESAVPGQPSFHFENVVDGA